MRENTLTALIEKRGDCCSFVFFPRLLLASSPLRLRWGDGLCVCVCIYIYVHTHTQTHTHVHKLKAWLKVKQTNL